MFSFKIIQKDKKSKARLGILRTHHGIIHTPTFTPVGTKGALRGLSFESAKKYGAEIFMMNTFHLFHNDRYKIIEKFGGLHKFLNIKTPIMTDSGGFQVFSLGFGAEHGVGKVANIFPEESYHKNFSRSSQSHPSSGAGLLISHPADRSVNLKKCRKQFIVFGAENYKFSAFYSSDQSRQDYEACS